MCLRWSDPDSLEYARVYVEAEERGLREQLEGMVRDETWKPMEDAQQTRVLHSASNLFAVIKRSLQRCSKHVSRGEALLHLLGAFQVWHRSVLIGCAMHY